MLGRILTRPRKKETEEPPPHDVIPVQFRWSEGCLFHRSMPAQAVPRQGDSAKIRSKHLRLDSVVENVEWLIMDGDPPWEYIRDEKGTGTYGRARIKAYVTLST